MNDLVFLDWIPSTGEDKYLGVITIKFNGFILRYKAQYIKDKNIIFVTPASFKIKDPITEKDRFLTGFDIDSSYDKERVINFVKGHVMQQVKPVQAQETQIPMPTNNLPF